MESNASKQKVKDMTNLTRDKIHDYVRKIEQKRGHEIENVTTFAETLKEEIDNYKERLTQDTKMEYGRLLNKLHSLEEQLPSTQHTAGPLKSTDSTVEETLPHENDTPSIDLLHDFEIENLLQKLEALTFQPMIPFLKAVKDYILRFDPGETSQHASLVDDYSEQENTCIVGKMNSGQQGYITRDKCTNYNAPYDERLEIQYGTTGYYSMEGTNLFRDKISDDERWKNTLTDSGVDEYENSGQESSEEGSSRYTSITTDRSSEYSDNDTITQVDSSDIDDDISISTKIQKRSAGIKSDVLATILSTGIVEEAASQDNDTSSSTNETLWSPEGQCSGNSGSEIQPGQELSEQSDVQNKIHIANIGKRVDDMSEQDVLSPQILGKTICDNQGRPEVDKIKDNFSTFATDCKVGQVYEENNFVGSVFDERGGYLRMHPGDIVLYIPPNAIKEGHRQPVYLYVDNNKCSQTYSDMVVLTPIVSCGPKVAKFEKEVVLTMPHCAANVNSWKLTTISESPGGERKNLVDHCTLVNEESVFILLLEFAKLLVVAKSRRGLGHVQNYLEFRNQNQSKDNNTPLHTQQQYRLTSTTGHGSGAKQQSGEEIKSASKIELPILLTQKAHQSSEAPLIPDSDNQITDGDYSEQHETLSCANVHLTDNEHGDDKPKCDMFAPLQTTAKFDSVTSNDTLQEQTKNRLQKDNNVAPYTSVNEITTDFERFASMCEIGEVFTSHADRSFVGSVFDDRGGYLKMEDEDVVLYIPPDAIEKGQRQPVFCHLSDFNSVSSDSGMVPLTPTVNCGPDGVNFEREVVLTIPHCATNAESWKFTGVTETTDGALITLPDENLMVNNSSIVLLLRHFTLFGAKGEATEENAQINVMIGVRCQCTDNRSCDIRVGAWIDMKSDHTRETQHIQTGSKEIWQIYERITIGIEDEVLNVELTYIEEGWERWHRQSHKVINTRNIKEDDGSVIAGCTFIVRYVGGEPGPNMGLSLGLSMDVSKQKYDVTGTIHLNDSKSNGEKADNSKLAMAGHQFCTTEFLAKPTEETSPVKRERNIQHDLNQPPHLTSQFGTTLFTRNISDHKQGQEKVAGEEESSFTSSKNFRTPTSWNQLCMILDDEHDGGGNWRVFAAKVNLTRFNIDNLARTSSPTSTLLSLYHSQKIVEGYGQNQILMELEDIFTSIKNNKAANIIREEIRQHKIEEWLCNIDNAAGEASEISHATENEDEVSSQIREAAKQSIVGQRNSSRMLRASVSTTSTQFHILKPNTNESVSHHDPVEESPPSSTKVKPLQDSDQSTTIPDDITKSHNNESVSHRDPVEESLPSSTKVKPLQDSDQSTISSDGITELRTNKIVTSHWKPTDGERAQSHSKSAQSDSFTEVQAKDTSNSQQLPERPSEIRDLSSNEINKRKKQSHHLRQQVSDIQNKQVCQSATAFRNPITEKQSENKKSTVVRPKNKKAPPNTQSGSNSVTLTPEQQKDTSMHIDDTQHKDEYVRQDVKTMKAFFESANGDKAVPFKTNRPLHKTRFEPPKKRSTVKTDRQKGRSDMEDPKKHSIPKVTRPNQTSTSSREKLSAKTQEETNKAVPNTKGKGKEKTKSEINMSREPKSKNKTAPQNTQSQSHSKSFTPEHQQDKQMHNNQNQNENAASNVKNKKAFFEGTKREKAEPVTTNRPLQQVQHLEPVKQRLDKEGDKQKGRSDEENITKQDMSKVTQPNKTSTSSRETLSAKSQEGTYKEGTKAKRKKEPTQLQMAESQSTSKVQTSEKSREDLISSEINLQDEQSETKVSVRDLRKRFDSQ